MQVPCRLAFYRRKVTCVKLIPSPSCYLVRFYFRNTSRAPRRPVALFKQLDEIEVDFRLRASRGRDDIRLVRRPPSLFPHDQQNDNRVAINRFRPRRTRAGARQFVVVDARRSESVDGGGKPVV